jgi:hypothetical protein
VRRGVVDLTPLFFLLVLEVMIVLASFHYEEGGQVLEGKHDLGGMVDLLLFVPFPSGSFGVELAGVERILLALHARNKLLPIQVVVHNQRIERVTQFLVLCIAALEETLSDQLFVHPLGHQMHAYP